MGLISTPMTSCPLFGQPQHIQALAAQRHKDPAARVQSQVRPVLHQVRINLAQMKTNLVIFPALVPKIRFHRLVLVPHPICYSAARSRGYAISNITPISGEKS